MVRAWKGLQKAAEDASHAFLRPRMPCIKLAAGLMQGSESQMIAVKIRKLLEQWVDLLIKRFYHLIL
jgi:hypothetical protein